MLSAIKIKVCISTVKLRNIEYLLQEAFTGIQRNGVMAIASISTIALSIGVLGAFILATLGANNFTAAQIGRFQIAAFMTNSANKTQVDMTVAQIQKIKGVESVAILDRDQEWADFKRDRPDIESAGLPLNVLPYAMNIKVSEPSRLPMIAAKVRAMNYIDAVRDGKEDLGRVMAVAHVIKGISLAGVLILFVTTVFIISNAIRLTLYARRREIRIMQLVGATNWFIRIPLVIEGVVFGAIGAFIAWILLRVGTIYICRLSENITFIGQFSSKVQPANFAVTLMLLGAAIGAAGSFVSIRRFLHD